MTMTELATAVANEKGSPIAAARRDVDMVIGCIAKALAKGEDVKLAGLGIFKVRETKSRTGRNPKTGEAIEIAAKKKVVFKASKELLTEKGGD